MNLKGAWMTIFPYLENANKVVGVVMVIAVVITNGVITVIGKDKVILTGMHLMNDMPHAIQM